MSTTIESGAVTLLICEQTGYKQKLFLHLDHMKAKVCYITFNTTAASLAEEAKDAKVELLLVIDGISRNMGLGSFQKGVHFLDKPTELQKLQVYVSNALELEEVNVFVLDNLSALMIYQDPTIVVRFIHGLVGIFKEHHATAIILNTSKDLKGASEVEMFMDKCMSM